MSPILAELSHQTSIRGRVAFCLSIGDKVLPNLKDQSNAFAFAQATLDDCWAWVGGSDIAAISIYESHIDELGAQGCVVTGSSEVAAMSAVTSAVFYALWHAFGEDLKHKRVEHARVPNDMFEVGEFVISETIEEACKCEMCDLEWIERLADRVIGKCWTEKPDESGEPLTRRSLLPTA